MPTNSETWLQFLFRRKTLIFAAFTIACIFVHLLLRFVFRQHESVFNVPLFACLFLGGVPMVFELLQKLFKLEFGSDLLGGISIITSVILGEYLAGAIIVLMLSGGQALEQYAIRNASSVLAALAKRVPSIAHRKADGRIADVALADLKIGDTLLIYPHEITPVDAVVVEGTGRMDESFLTGEPFEIEKTVGSNVISGAINGESVLGVRAIRLPADSRYARIMQVMNDSQSTRPQMRRLGDKLGAIYTPIALLMAIAAWAFSGDAVRFLSVLVIATPCPLLIAIPVAIIGSISLCARHAIIVKNAVALENISTCRTAIFDKTGTLTYGQPTLTEQLPAPSIDATTTLQLVSSLERYSKHPLARAILAAAEAQSIKPLDCTSVSESPGQGLSGMVAGKHVTITSRKYVVSKQVAGFENLPPNAGGLECAVVIDDVYAGVLRFRDAPRAESKSFISHLKPMHRFNRVMIVSGDREGEVAYLAKQVGVSEVFADKTPEEKLAIVRSETARAPTLYVGDGINDAPAMMAATVGMAIGQNSDVTAEAAGVVILDNQLGKVDVFMHISRRMRTIALQCAIGGMLLSVVGMVLAAMGYISPVNGAIMQEGIDVLAVLNALRAAWPPKVLSDA